MTYNLFSPQSPSALLITWSVSELTGYIRELFEIDFRLREVRVQGEISNFSRARSGHLYFTLKDERSQLKCVMWRQAAEGLHFLPGDGDAVIVEGQITVYEAGGVYQLYADHIRPAGRGDLAAAFQRLKEKLYSEGLFDSDHKKPLPPFPRKIGVVTSADAAALRDILTVLRRRCPLVQVLIAPTAVQGDGAPAQIIRALRWLDGRDDIDIIIIARGGGSIEDLWAFNDERLARAIFACHHPTICGVGHEGDISIADLVADVRAPTPSAAAELAVPDLAEMAGRIDELDSRLRAWMAMIIDIGREEVGALSRALSYLSPRHTFINSRQLVDMLAMRLEGAIARRLEGRQSRLQILEARLASVDPLATLARGYAIVYTGSEPGKDGAVVRHAADVAPGDSLRIRVSDGEFNATVVRGTDAD